MSTSFGAIIHVTGDDYSIQDAIDSAGDVDTVVVYQGVYEENLLINKSITLTSLALFDTTDNTIIESLGDDWIEYNSTFIAWEVANELINSTIIDGSGELKSTITIATEEDICIEPIILGFTIQDGAGTLVYRFYENLNEGNEFLFQIVGGGVLSYLANPTLHYNKIQNNGIEAYCSEAWDWIDNQYECQENGWTWLNGTKTGSAIYAATDSDDIGIWERTKTSDRDCVNNSYDFTYNFFENNYSSLGRHIGNRSFAGNFDLSNCVFDVWNCQDGGVYQTPIWVNIDDMDNLVAEDEENSSCLYVGGEIYVDPVSGNDDLNDGLSWEGAFYTITHAIASVVGTEENPVNIHLAEGVYSPSTNGEIFPIEMISYVNFIGQGEEITILDAEQTHRVITMENCENNIISDLSITGGLADGSTPDNRGGGMYLLDSNPTLTNVTISGNTAAKGGGMYLLDSNPTLTNFTIANNTAIERGGGMYLYSSNPTLTYVTISENAASAGGGMACFNNSNSSLTNVTIANNTVGATGGGISLSDSNPTFTNVTIANNMAYHDGGGIIIGWSDPTLTNVTIANNTAGYIGCSDCAGGGMYSYESSPTLTHVTIANNTSFERGGGMYIWSNAPTLINSIIWDNSPESIHGGTPIIAYSDIEGGWESEWIICANSEDDELNEYCNTLLAIEFCENAIYLGVCTEYYNSNININSNPLFTDPGNGDYTLMKSSPCIDAGTADTDGDGNEDINITDYCGEAPDMGAFEYITEDCEECPDSIEGDTNIDGSVNILDIVIVANCILSDSCDICFDLNADEQLNILDIVLIVNIILNP